MLCELQKVLHLLLLVLMLLLQLLLKVLELDLSMLLLLLQLLDLLTVARVEVLLAEAREGGGWAEARGVVLVVGAREDVLATAVAI